MTVLTRRHLIAGAAGIAGSALLPRATARYDFTRKVGAPTAFKAGKTVEVALVAAERPTALPCFGGRTLPMWTFTDGAWPPVVRLDYGDRLHATLANTLPRDQYNSIHWHGVRLPNSQDGVPYLIQQPVQPGQHCEYSFAPPDTGTFFFHTHCNTVEQLGRGLLGVLIVDGDVIEPYDADQVLVIRDWQVDLDAGEFNAFFTLRGAARAGSYGTVRSVNGVTNPRLTLPAAGDCRLRLINTDPTRILHIGIEEAQAAIVGVDGVGCQPFELTVWPMAPGSRIDVVMRSPDDGGVARLVDKTAGPTPVEIARFVGTGPSRRMTDFDPAPLRGSRIRDPNLRTATRLDFVFEATEAGRVLTAFDDIAGADLGELCVSSKLFWTINGKPWPDRGHAKLPPPIAVMQRNRSYIFRMINKTPFTHPIHIHGHSFKRFASSMQRWTPHNVDTFLLLPGEIAESAIYADNPGDWMMHCHVLEHQESGMMAYFRVT